MICKNLQTVTWVIIDASSRRRSPPRVPSDTPVHPMSRHTGSPYQETHPQHSQVVMPDCHVFWTAYSKCNFLMTPHVRLSVVVGSYTSMPLSQHSIQANLYSQYVLKPLTYILHITYVHITYI